MDFVRIRGFEVDSTILSVIISKAKDVETAEELMEYLEKAFAFQPNEVTYRNLIRVAGRVKNEEKIKKYFVLLSDVTATIDPLSFITVINAFVQGYLATLFSYLTPFL